MITACLLSVMYSYAFYVYRRRLYIALLFVALFGFYFYTVGLYWFIILYMNCLFFPFHKMLFSQHNLYGMLTILTLGTAIILPNYHIDYLYMLFIIGVLNFTLFSAMQNLQNDHIGSSVYLVMCNISLIFVAMSYGMYALSIVHFFALNIFMKYFMKYGYELNINNKNIAYILAIAIMLMYALPNNYYFLFLILMTIYIISYSQYEIMHLVSYFLYINIVMLMTGFDMHIETSWIRILSVAIILTPCFRLPKVFNLWLLHNSRPKFL